MKTKTNTIYLIISIAIFFAFLTAYFLLYSSFSALADENKSLVELTSRNRARLAELQKVEKNLSTTLAEKDSLAALFVRQDSIAEFIKIIESIMKRQGLSGSIESVTEENPPELDGTDKEKLSISLSASGDWAGVAKFIGLLEKLPYKSILDSVALVYGNKTFAFKGAKESAWNALIKMNVLAEKPAEAGPAPDTITK